MNRYSMSPRAMTLLAVLMAASALGGCNRREDTQTSGEKVDAAVARADEKLEQAKASTEKALENAKQASTDAMSSAATAVGDTAITAAVKSSLAGDAGLSGSDVGVETREGKVTLSGKAADGVARDRAVQLATAVKGVVAVNDQMTTAR